MTHLGPDSGDASNIIRLRLRSEELPARQCLTIVEQKTKNLWVLKEEKEIIHHKGKMFGQKVIRVGISIKIMPKNMQRSILIGPYLQKQKYPQYVVHFLQLFTVILYNISSKLIFKTSPKLDITAT